MKKLLPHLSVLSRVRISNAWLLTADEGRRVLVDCGHRAERGVLQRDLARAGVRGKGDLDAVVLTHGHSDHAHNASWVRDTFGCPVVCHSAEASMLGEDEPRPRLGGRGAAIHHDLLCRLEDRWPARCEPDEVFEEGPWRWGIRVFHTPGHTPGSVLLLHEPTGTLFTGDTVVAGLPTQRTVPWMRTAIPEYSFDADQARRELSRVLGRVPLVRAVASGHGPLVTRSVDRRVRALVA